MILDHEAEFSLNQAINRSATTVVSENVYDCGPVHPHLGEGEPIQILCTVTEVFAGTGANLVVTVQDCATVGGSYANILGASSGTILKATLAAGHQFVITIPPVDHARFLGLLYTANATFETTGKITAGVIKDFQSNRSW